MLGRGVNVSGGAVFLCRNNCSDDQVFVPASDSETITDISVKACREQNAELIVKNWPRLAEMDTATCTSKL
jgi:hypothetical protein